MFKKTALVLAFSMLMTPLAPTAALSWYAPQPRYDSYRGHDFDYYRGRNYRHTRHGDDAVLWGVAGLILGTVIVASALQPPPPPQPVTYYPPQTRIYNYPPYVPPGMCRWERYILDGYGRMVLDPYGQPVKQYIIGSCQYPPN